jgi:hypothetical protein
VHPSDAVSIVKLIDRNSRIIAVLIAARRLINYSFAVFTLKTLHAYSLNAHLDRCNSAFRSMYLLHATGRRQSRVDIPCKRHTGRSHRLHARSGTGRRLRQLVLSATVWSENVRPIYQFDVIANVRSRRSRELKRLTTRDAATVGKRSPTSSIARRRRRPINDCPKNRLTAYTQVWISASTPHESGCFQRFRCRRAAPTNVVAATHGHLLTSFSFRAEFSRTRDCPRTPTETFSLHARGGLWGASFKLFNRYDSDNRRNETVSSGRRCERGNRREGTAGRGSRSAAARVENVMERARGALGSDSRVALCSRFTTSRPWIAPPFSSSLSNSLVRSRFG